MSKKDNSIPSLIDFMTKSIGKSEYIFKLSEIKERDYVGCLVPSPQFEHVLESSKGLIPYGSIVEFIGWESVGKTTWAWQILASELLYDLRSIGHYNDVERSGQGYQMAEVFNVDNNRCWISQPNSAKEALNSTTAFLLKMKSFREQPGVINLPEKDKPHCVCILDSVAALNPTVLIAGDEKEEKKSKQKALLASMMSEYCKGITSLVVNAGAILIFINQWRHAFDFKRSWNEPCGGTALRFTYDLRFSIIKLSVEKVGDEEVGLKCLIKNIKHKFGTSNRKAEVVFGWGNGPYDLGMDLFYDLHIISEKKGFRFQPKGNTWSTIFINEKGSVACTSDLEPELLKTLADTKNKIKRNDTLKELKLTDIRFQGISGLKKKLLKDKKLLDELIDACELKRYKALFHDRYKAMKKRQEELSIIEEEDITHEVDIEKDESGGKIKQIDDGGYTSPLDEAHKRMTEDVAALKGKENGTQV